MKKKTVALILACALLCGVAMGGTLAWLTAETPSVQNVFTVGDINLDLKEHVYVPATNSLSTEITVKNENYGYVPGDALPKDPFVTVKATSEDCWLFVKVEETNNNIADVHVADIIQWTVEPKKVGEDTADTSWTKYTDKSSGTVEFWYRKVTKDNDADQSWYVLKDNQVTVSEDVTKAMVTGLNTNKPTITVSAAAVQSAHIDTVADAWAELSDDFTGETTATAPADPTNP